MMEKHILIAGFGGQGILFAGKFLAYAGLVGGMQLSWLPSYGPEMRGGTANCSVILSDGQIGSPLVTRPDILIAMNLPSLDKYGKDVRPGGQIYYNSSMTGAGSACWNAEVIAVPATEMADDCGLGGLANMIMIGSMLRHSGLFPLEDAQRIMEKVVPHGDKGMMAQNMKAIHLGYRA